MRWTCPALEAVLPDVRTNLSLSLLGDYLDPHKVLRVRRATFVFFVSKNVSGNHPHSGPVIEALVERLWAAAKETIILQGNAVDFVLLQAEASIKVAQLHLPEAQLKALDRSIEVLHARLQPSRRSALNPGHR